MLIILVVSDDLYLYPTSSFEHCFEINHRCCSQEAPMEEGVGFGSSMDGIGACPPPRPHVASDASGRGWEHADAMYTDHDFKMGCLAFTHFYKGWPSMMIWVYVHVGVILLYLEMYLVIY